MSRSGEAWPNPWVDRLERQLEALDGPLVQILDWPGTGKRLLLAELSARGGHEVPPVALRDAGLLRRAAREARQAGSPWLLCRHWPHTADPLVPGPVLDELMLRPLLVFSSHHRRTLEGSSASVLGPRALLLAEDEVLALWRSFTGEGLGGERCRDFLTVTGGWYRPLLLAARAAAQGRPVTADPSSWLAVEEISEFLRWEVLEGVSLGDEGEREQLREELFSRGMKVSGSALQGHLPGLLETYLQRAPDRPRKASSLAGEDHRTEALPSPAASGSNAGPSFDVRLFGTPSVQRRDASGASVEVRWELRRAFKIFAFLASRREHQAAREELFEAVFLEQSAGSIRRNFHPTLSYLRRNLVGSGGKPQVVQYRQGTYRLNPEVDWHFDVARFEALAARATDQKARGQLEACAATARQAWGLYRGPFLHGTYDSWAVERRDSLQTTYLSLLRDLGESYESLGRLPEALDAYRAVLVEDSLEETLQVAIMGIYAALGRRDLVRRQYDRLTGLLMEELGVEPLPRTTAEYHRLMG